MAENSLITQEQYNADMKRLYEEKIYPYLNGATHTGCVPLGTILPYFGETAPTHFLICDGTEYAKADYPELAEHLLALTDPTPYAGSDANHFKVPDLRGEFLRGSGTNGHSGQGNGDTVGTHQNATTFPILRNNKDKLLIYGRTKDTEITVSNPDFQVRDGKYYAVINDTLSITPLSDNGETVIATRPTNTSVTYIIAYRNAYIDLALDSFPIDITQPTDGQLLMYDATAGKWVNGGHKYSTDEHVVGTWIDGKPLYEKVIIFTIPSTTTQHLLVDIGEPIDFPIIKEIMIPNNARTAYSNQLYFQQAMINERSSKTFIYTNSSTEILENVPTANKFRYSNYDESYSGRTAYAIIQYTKTTDTV